MTNTGHEIMLKAESKSKAKILWKHVKSYMVGHKFQVLFEFTNVGSTVFPGGSLGVLITWPNGQVVQFEYQIPKLGLGDMYKAPHFTTDALSRGYGLFSVSSYGSKEGEVRFRDQSGKSIFGQPSFYSVLAKEPEEIYEFWGMVIAAISLAFLVGIELIRFVIWLGTLMN